MNATGTELMITLIMVAVVFLLSAWFLKYKADSSERRMRSMLKRCGLDPEVIEQGDTETIMKQVRSRCRKCQNEDVCERWLSGEGLGKNSFCPNAQTFEVLFKNKSYPSIFTRA